MHGIAMHLYDSMGPSPHKEENYVSARLNSFLWSSLTPFLVCVVNIHTQYALVWFCVEGQLEWVLANSVNRNAGIQEARSGIATSSDLCVSEW